MLNAPELADATLLVLANKQDLPKAASAGELAHLLGVDKFRGRTWHVQACNALTGDGLFEGMDWLAKSVKRT
jgi:ADP-ribosylation factor protein 1